MNDTEFFQLQLKAQICPRQCRWPKPDVTFSIAGNKPMATGMHWQRLHEAANEVREHVSKAYSVMDQIDCNSALSPDGKCHQRSKTAAEGIADLEASKALARAREAVELAAAKEKSEQQVSPDIAEARKGNERSRAGLPKGDR